MADHLEGPRRLARRRRVAINRECIFQALPWNEIAELFSGIQDASSSEEMALLANAVAGRWLELCRIDDRSGARIRKMFFDGAVASFASDRFRRKNGISILVQRASDMQRRSGVAKDASLADGSREIGIRLIFIAGRQIVSVAPCIISDGRLKEMAAEVHQITAGVSSGANHKVDAVLGAVATVFPSLPITGCGRMHGNRRAMRGHDSVRFLPGASQGMRHRRTRVSLDLGRMAEHAAARAGGRACQRRRGGRCVRRGGAVL